jgi:hypothetical protein
MGGKNGQPVRGPLNRVPLDSVEVPTTTESRLSTIPVITAQLGDLRCASLSRAPRGRSGAIVSKFGFASGTESGRADGRWHVLWSVPVTGGTVLGETRQHCPSMHRI